MNSSLHITYQTIVIHSVLESNTPFSCKNMNMHISTKLQFNRFTLIKRILIGLEQIRNFINTSRKQAYLILTFI